MRVGVRDFSRQGQTLQQYEEDIDVRLNFTIGEK